MSIKSIALVVATVAVTATGASAENYFGLGQNLDQSSVLDLGLVRADAAGVVEVYDFNGGKQGKLLGSEPVFGGANTDVRVNVGGNPQADVIAVLKVNGSAVAEKDYDIIK